MKTILQDGSEREKTLHQFPQTMSGMKLINH